MAGRYILVEGIDGAGKSTVVAELAKKLAAREQPFELFENPTPGPVGQMIRKIFAGEVKVDRKAMLWLFVADALDQEKKIREMLANDIDVIMHRHSVFSGFCYQTSEHLLETVTAVSQAQYFRAPDFAFILDVPSEVALERMGKRGSGPDNLYEDADLQELDARRGRYALLQFLYPGVLVLDGTRSVETNVQAILSVVDYAPAGKN